jgi:hypothetical protein
MIHPDDIFLLYRQKLMNLKNFVESFKKNKKAENFKFPASDCLLSFLFGMVQKRLISAPGACFPGGGR